MGLTDHCESLSYSPRVDNASQNIQIRRTMDSSNCIALTVENQERRIIELEKDLKKCKQDIELLKNKKKFQEKFTEEPEKKTLRRL